jgi:hypothetical protein
MQLVDTAIVHPSEKGKREANNDRRRDDRKSPKNTIRLRSEKGCKDVYRCETVEPER